MSVDAVDTAADSPAPLDRPLRRALRRYARNRGAVVGAAILFILSVISVLVPWLAVLDPEAVDLSHQLQPPGRDHWFGTDHLGRDYLARTIYGGRISLAVGFVAMLLSIVIGTLVGATSGFAGGRLDNLLMRVVDFINSLPIFFIIMVAQMVLTPNIFNVMWLIGLTSWMAVARIVRGEVLAQREQDYVMAAKAIGSRSAYIVWRHILPNVSGPIIVAATLNIAQAILIESALSFLGLGVQPPKASWGNMLMGAQTRMFNAPWIAIFPGLMICITVISFNFVGDGLRDALDPKTGRKNL